MDPNEALQRLREWAGGVADGEEMSAEMEAAEAFEGLDGWLSRGGFLPADWQSEAVQ